ncbi:unnamed protein product, partial [Ixodes persulcatus]
IRRLSLLVRPSLSPASQPPLLAGWPPRPRALWMPSPLRYARPSRRPDPLGRGPIFRRLPSPSHTRRTMRTTSPSRTSPPPSFVCSTDLGSYTTSPCPDGRQPCKATPTRRHPSSSARHY